MKVFIVHASAGHGHKRIAESIHQEFKNRENPNVEVRVIDALDYSSKFFKWTYQSIYYVLVKYFPILWGWGYKLFNIKPFLRFINPLRSFLNKLQIKKLLKLIDEEKPDFIINTHFLLPTVLGPMIEKGKLKTRMITVVTDFKVHGFWISEGQELYIGMCETTKAGLLEWGIPEDRIVLWGIPVHPRFRQHLGRTLLIQELGLEEGKFNILLTSGSFGIGPVAEMLNVLKAKAPKIQVIIVTGKNEVAYQDLIKREYAFPTKIYGYVENMDQLMEVSDLAVIKPGGSTTCELLVKACPFLMLKPIPGQEEGNGEVVVLEGISQFINHPREILEKWPSVEDPLFAKRLREAIARFAKPDSAPHIVEYIYAQLR